MQSNLKQMAQSSYKMIITKELERKIKHICSKINNIEWSGVLFYDHTGDFETENLVITAQDLIVLDIGNASTTEFQHNNPDVVSYMIENNLLDCDMALIHSHHIMATNPSGTDLDTLFQEGSDRNVFVSLIVNNAGNYHAFITRKVCSNITETKYYKTFRDKEKEGSETNYESITVEYFELQIVKEENEDTDLFPEITERIKLLYQQKEERKAAVEQNPVDWQMYYNTQYDYNIKPVASKSVENNVSQVIDNIVIKLITGDILATTTNTDIKIAALRMFDRFNAVFANNMDNFDWYAQSIVEYLLSTWDEEVMGTVEKLIERLREIAPNKFTEEYINYIEDYI